MSHHEEELAHLENGGLPEPLPRNERVLWEGAPDWRKLAIRVFHARKIAIYFAGLLAWRIVANVSDGAPIGQTLVGSMALALLGTLAVGLLCLIAWFTARTALYTITNQRVVMRVGIVLTVTFNLPFKSIGSAGLKRWRDGSGDIPLVLTGSDRIAYLNLWPHARPWRVKHPQPMLRSIPAAERVASILSQALAASAGIASRPVAANDDTPCIVPVHSGPMAAA